MERIVVGVDGSAVGASALRWAAAEAARHDRPLVALLAWGFLDQHHADPGTSFDPDYGVDDAEAALEAHLVAALGEDGARGVVRQVVNDLAAPALVAAAGAADLLVVGARGLGGFKGLLLGSVSQHVLHHARGPVAVIRDDAGAATTTDPPRIVVGVDGSSSAAAALRWAVAEARASQGVLEVVHAWHLPYAGGYPYSAAAFEPGIFEEAARLTLRDALAAVDGEDLPHPVRTQLVQQGAVPALLEAADEAALVVAGSRGLGGFRGLLLGSVSHQLAQHATCPVVIVPGEG